MSFVMIWIMLNMYLMDIAYYYISKLGVAIKTTISTTVLEEALNGNVDTITIQLGQSLSTKVKYILQTHFILSTTLWNPGE